MRTCAARLPLRSQAILAFYFPEAFAAIDWTRGYQFIDKELAQADHRSETMSDELESVTRAERVDRLLAQAGWTRASRRLIDEFFLAGDTAVRGDDGPEPKDAFIDNALLLPDGRPIAIVEVKRLLREALEGECQSADYAERCKRKYGLDPFIFLTNGDEIWFWHRSLYPPRSVSGFFTQDDLERLAFIDRFHEAPSAAAIDGRIVDRAYQLEAVKTVAERIELGCLDIPTPPKFKTPFQRGRTS